MNQPIVPVLFLLFHTALAQLPASAEACRELAALEQRIDCYRTGELSPLPAPGHSATSSAAATIHDPAEIGALRSRMDSAAGGGDWEVAARAGWQLLESGAATEDFHWIDAGGSTVWTASIDGGSGELARIAEALHRAGRDDLAEPVLRQALILGRSPIAPDGWASRVRDRLAPPTEPIRAETWYRALDSMTLDIIDGEPVQTGDLRGDVLVLDFWAGWCEPCREELPLMQAFHEENRHRGLQTFAVNVDEPRSTARASANMLGLDLPIAVYTPELREVFGVSQLPTVILVDRVGRIRGRWEVFKEGTEQQIFWAIGEILDEQQVEAETVAQRLVGGPVLAVRWMRQFRAPVEGVAVVASPDGGSRIALTHGRTLLVLQPGGDTEAKVSGVVVAGRLVASTPDDEGGYALLSYRLGATDISRIDFPGGSNTVWTAPAPVFDARWLDPRRPRSGAVLGTLDGITLVDHVGSRLKNAEVGLVRGVVPRPAAAGGAPNPAWLALTGRSEPRQLVTLGADLSVLGSSPVGSNSWRIDHGGTTGRFGLFPTSVRALAVGRFLEGVEQEQIAVAGGGQLVLLAADDGRELFRARWDEVSHLAAGDLDGDGRDELIVAWDDRLAVLGTDPESADSKKAQKM